MLSALSRLALILGISASFLAFEGHRQSVYAEDDEEEEGDEEEEEEDGGDEGGEEECEDEEECGIDKDQPDITAGGLFTIKTYPKRELFRPLTMTEKVTQVRAALGVDVSDKTAFEYYGITLDGEYGLKDNFTLLAGFGGDYNFKAFDINVGFEGGLAYDLFDIRLQARISRGAVPTMRDEATNKPTEYGAGAGTQFSVDLGFPFRYVARPEIAIVALETLIQFDFNGIERGAGGGGLSCQAFNNVMLDENDCTEDGIKPDLSPSIGIASNPIEILSLVLFAQLQIRDFDTTNSFVIPATARVMFTPSQKFDIGLEFKFLNLKPPAPPEGGEAQKFYDNRFMNMFVQARY